MAIKFISSTPIATTTAAINTKGADVVIRNGKVVVEIRKGK